MLILASLLAIWVIKKEWQYLKEYRKATEKEHKIARESRLHIIKDITSTLFRSIRLVVVSVEDLLHVIKITLLALRRSKVKKARVLSLAKARYIRALEKSNRLLIFKQKAEEKLLAFELARRERVARLEFLVKHHINIKDRIKSIRTLLLKSVSITEKQISNISESFKKSLPSMPELQPHPELKVVSAYENDAREFTYLYNRVDQHIKENNLEAAKEAYNALISVFNKLINETSNKYELISAAKEIQSRLELAILSDRAREKIEEYKSKDTEIKIEKLPQAKKYPKSEKLTEEELNIDYLKELLKKN